MCHSELLRASGVCSPFLCAQPGKAHLTATVFTLSALEPNRDNKPPAGPAWEQDVYGQYPRFLRTSSWSLVIGHQAPRDVGEGQRAVSSFLLSIRLLYLLVRYIFICRPYHHQ